MGCPRKCCVHLYASVFYRCLSPQFQFSVHCYSSASLWSEHPDTFKGVSEVVQKRLSSPKSNGQCDHLPAEAKLQAFLLKFFRLIYRQNADGSLLGVICFDHSTPANRLYMLWRNLCWLKKTLILPYVLKMLFTEY